MSKGKNKIKAYNLPRSEAGRAASEQRKRVKDAALMMKVEKMSPNEIAAMLRPKRRRPDVSDDDMYEVRRQAAKEST